MSQAGDRGILIPIGSGFIINCFWASEFGLPSPYDTEIASLVNSWSPATLGPALLTGLSGTFATIPYAPPQYALEWVNGSGFNFLFETQMVLKHGLYTSTVVGQMDKDPTNALQLFMDIWGSSSSYLLCSYNPTSGWSSGVGTITGNTFTAASPGQSAFWCATLAFDTVSFGGVIDCSISVMSFNNLAYFLTPQQGFQWGGGFVSYP